MGGKTNTTTTQSTPNASALSAYSNLLNQAGTVASTPYTPYTNELVAPVNAQQYAGINNINANAGFALPYINAAAGYAQAAAQPITASQIQQYMDPYTQSVVNATEQQFNLQNAQQQNTLVGNAAAQGALGGNRVGVAQANLAGQQQTAQAPVIAGLESQGYQTGLNTALTEQQNLGQAAYSLGNLGVAGQNAALTGANAQVGAGTLEQQTQQASDVAQYQQFQNALAYPFQTTQWLAGLDTGVGSQMGGTSSTTGPSPSLLSQLSGLGISALGLTGATGGFGSNGWLSQLGHARGGRIAGFDAGGGVAGSPWASGIAPWNAGVAYVPQAQITPGRGAPPPPQTQQQQSGATQMVNQASQVAKLIRGGGQGGVASDADQAGPEGWANGGLIRLPKHNRIELPRHYDDGGSVAGFGTGSFIPANALTTQPEDPLQYYAAAPAPNVGFSDSFNDRFGNISQAPAALASPLPVDNGDARGIDRPVNWAPDQNKKLADVQTALMMPTSGVALPPEITAGTSHPSPDAGLGDTSALAYDGSQAGAPTGGPAPQPQPQPPPSHGGLGANSDIWPALMAAGFGMMASTSPFPAVAIGQGGLQGVQQYQQQQQQHLSERKIQLEAEKLSKQADLWAAEIRKSNVETQSAQENLNALRALRGQPPIDLMGTGATPKSGLTSALPSQGAIGAATEDPQIVLNAATAQAGRVVGVTQTPQGPIGVDAFGQGVINPNALLATAQRYIQSGLPSFQSAGEKMMQLYESMITKGVTTDANGRVIPMPGAAETAARAAGMRTQAEEANKVREVQPTPGGPTYYATGIGGQPGAGSPPGGAAGQNLGAVAKQPAFIEKRQEAIAKDEEAMDTSFRQRQVARERLQEIAKILQTYQTGRFAESKAALIANARAFGLNVPDLQSANPAAYEQFIKNATKNVFDDVKSMGGRILVSEIEGLTRANANPSLQPEANRAILGQALGLLDYEDKHYGDYRDWKSQNPYAYDTSPFEREWTKNNPVSRFTKAGQQNTPVLGEQRPANDQYEIGKVYINPNGQKGRWNGKSFDLVQ